MKFRKAVSNKYCCRIPLCDNVAEWNLHGGPHNQLIMAMCDRHKEMFGYPEAESPDLEERIFNSDVNYPAACGHENIAYALYVNGAFIAGPLCLPCISQLERAIEK